MTDLTFAAQAAYALIGVTSWLVTFFGAQSAHAGQA